MEYLAELYEERLQELKKMFLNLLNNLEESRLFASKPSHSQYRIEYVGAMVSEALKTQQQLTIKKLLKQVGELRKKLEQKQGKQYPLKNRDQHKGSNYDSFGSLSLENSQQKERKVHKVLQKSKQWGTPDTKLSSLSDWTDEDNGEMGKKHCSIEDSISSCNFKYLKLKF